MRIISDRASDEQLHDAYLYAKEWGVCLVQGWYHVILARCPLEMLFFFFKSLIVVRQPELGSS